MSTSAARQWISLLGLGVVVMTTAIIVVLLAVQLSATPSSSSSPTASARIEIGLDVGNQSRCVDPCGPALLASAGDGAQRAA